jgi:glutamate-1-semialdehyde 2,1-aminomutase
LVLPVGAFARNEIIIFTAPLGPDLSGKEHCRESFSNGSRFGNVNQINNNPAIFTSLNDKTSYLANGIRQSF